MLDRFATWLFRRTRKRYVLMLELLGDAYLVLGVGTPSVLTIAYYFGFTGSEFAISLAVASVIVVMGVRLGLFLKRRELRVFRSWLRDEPTDPGQVYEESLVMLLSFAATTMAIQTPAHLVITAGVFARYGSPSILGFVAMEIQITAVLLAGALVVLQGFQALMRPALAEVSTQVADVPLLRRAFSVASRFTMGFLATGVLAGTVATSVSSRAGSLVDRWPIAAAGALVLTVYVTFLFRIGLVDAALEPLQDVVAATRRVRAGDFSTPVVVTSPDELGDLAASFNEMQRGLREREALQTAFGSYVDPVLARRLLEQGDSVFEGEETEVSVFFADIRGFTTYAEQASVRDAVATLNRFFSIVVRVISEHGGHTNAYLGDGVLAVFGTPLALDDHADRAVAAARAVEAQVCDQFGDTLRIGIGVNTGRVIAGTVGGEGKLEFTVIGDPVNVAARVEQLTKETGDGILITAATREAMRQPVDMTDRGEFEVRGKQRRVRLFSVA